MIDIVLIVEGETERTFVRDILAPEMSHKNISIRACLIGKPGHKGGNVKFERLKTDLRNLFSWRKAYISTMLDFFRIDSRWPGLEKICTSNNISAIEKAKILENATADAIETCFGNNSNRFIPYIQMHEFEALLFSDLEVLSRETKIDLRLLQQDLENSNCEPEEINTSPEGAPSKRLERLTSRQYNKIVTGITIAEAIGIEKIREKCPHFNSWLQRLEQLNEI